MIKVTNSVMHTEAKSDFTLLHFTLAFFIILVDVGVLLLLLLFLLVYLLFCRPSR